MTKFKRIKNYTPFEERDTGTNNPLYAVQANPDLLSDEQTLGLERDVDSEEDRKELIRLTKLAIATLSPREKQVVELLQVGNTQEEVAKILKLSRFAVTTLLQRAQKKVKNFVDNSTD